MFRHSNSLIPCQNNIGRVVLMSPFSRTRVFNWFCFSASTWKSMNTPTENIGQLQTGIRQWVAETHIACLERPQTIQKSLEKS
jgi:hypothetical protein